jgi:hypothetical protein
MTAKESKDTHGVILVDYVARLQEPLMVGIRVHCLDFGLGLPTACRRSIRFLSQQVPMLLDNTRQRTAGNSMILSKWRWKILSHLDLAPSAVPTGEKLLGTLNQNKGAKEAKIPLR